MADVIKMPKLSDTMSEGVISSWLKRVGDFVKVGDVLAEVDTDKATMELEAYHDGVLLYIGAKEKEAVAVGSIIAIIGEENEDYTSLLINDNVDSGANSKDPSLLEEVEKIVSSDQLEVAYEDVNRIKASPLAKKIAKTAGYDLNLVSGTGPGGRIIKSDLEYFATTKSINADYSTGDKYFEVELSPMRRAIAKKLSESKYTAPHFYLSINVNMTNLVKLRDTINLTLSPDKISFNDIIIKAVAISLESNKEVNATFVNNKIRYNEQINLGIAMAIEDGLIVPIIKSANKKGLKQISGEVKELYNKASENKIKQAEIEGATFTISNLGMFGIDSFTAIINPPAVCILAVGAIKKAPIIQENALAIGYIANMTLSSDHRVVDGAVGAKFLNNLREILENPLKILV
jgi:pyruvate dehydrogenase E2 component (dihydrolipoamide acetyltransferase)